MDTDTDATVIMRKAAKVQSKGESKPSLALQISSNDTSCPRDKPGFYSDEKWTHTARRKPMILGSLLDTSIKITHGPFKRPGDFLTADVRRLR